MKQSNHTSALRRGEKAITTIKRLVQCRHQHGTQVTPKFAIELIGQAIAAGAFAPLTATQRGMQALYCDMTDLSWTTAYPSFLHWHRCIQRSKQFILRRFISSAR